MRPAGRSITLLGRVAIAAANGATSTTAPRGRRAELVFAYLAAEHHRLVSHDELADALWPEGLPETWQAALRGVLTDVRRYLADSGLDPSEMLTTARRGHQLQLPPGVTVDLDDARATLATARSRLAEGAAAEAAEAAAHASALALLPFLPSHEGEWTDGVRRELATIAARALELEARAHAAAGDPGSAEAAAARLVLLEPFNEAGHQLRIRLLGQAGDRAGAIKAYEQCRAVLAAELGVEPSDETDAAYRAATVAPAATAASSTGAAGPLASLSMLVVEDHDFQRRTAVMLLRNLGIDRIGEASDGLAALDLLGRTEAPDVILCDIDMPAMDGLEFIRHVAERELAGAVVIASGLDAKVIHAVRAVVEGYGLQVLGAVEKPLTARRLGELLGEYRPRRRPAPVLAPTDVSRLEARSAWREGRIGFRLQPVVDVATGRIAAAAMIPSWSNGAAGPVAPEVFLPLLEDEGLLAEVDQRAVVVASDEIGRLGDARLPVGLSIALAAASIHDRELPDRAAEALRSRAVDPARLTFRLDERAVRSAPSAALQALTGLRVKGCGVGLDSFGSGRAPFELRRSLPLTDVRIAPAFVHEATADPEAAEVLEEAIRLARQLEVAVVGGGCDGEPQLELLLGLGCDRLQGTAIAEPMPGDELPAWVAQWDPDRLGVGGR